MTVATKQELLHRIKTGHIVSPPELVQENSINVRLGAELWTPRAAPQGEATILHHDRHWEAVETFRTYEVAHKYNQPMTRVRPGMRWHVLEPGRLYLGTTLDAHGSQFVIARSIGNVVRRMINVLLVLFGLSHRLIALKGDGIAYVPEMRARSTTGRHGLTVALCAGVGDVGYRGRWALEIMNNGPDPVIIAAGTEIGQVVFHRATKTYPSDGYGGADRYQKDDGEIQFLPKPYQLPPTDVIVAARKQADRFSDAAKVHNDQTR